MPRTLPMARVPLYFTLKCCILNLGLERRTYFEQLNSLVILLLVNFGIQHD